MELDNLGQESVWGVDMVERRVSVGGHGNLLDEWVGSPEVFGTHHHHSHAGFGEFHFQENTTFLDMLKPMGTPARTPNHDLELESFIKEGEYYNKRKFEILHEEDVLMERVALLERLFKLEERKIALEERKRKLRDRVNQSRVLGEKALVQGKIRASQKQLQRLISSPYQPVLTEQFSNLKWMNHLTQCLDFRHLFCYSSQNIIQYRYICRDGLSILLFPEFSSYIILVSPPSL